MDESVFLYWWFSFDLQYYLILGGTNNVLNTSVKNFLCTLWSLVLAKKYCSNISNAARKFPDYVISCDYDETNRMGSTKWTYRKEQ